MPLTHDGTRHEAIEDMVTLLVATGKRDLLLLGYTFASLVFEGEAEQHGSERGSIRCTTC
ncbi:MAG TPA: hypothetical protein VHZ51_22720 [Ktedonobacteraceae bacterium]|nr:hypothetical protein [Ktedonobacteraceae bacterium]